MSETPNTHGRLTYRVTGEGDPLFQLFQETEGGKLQLGVAGESKSFASAHELLEREVEFRGYVMEGFVAYFVKVAREGASLLVSVRVGDGNRDQHLPWLIEQYFESKGCSATRVA